MVKSPSVSVKYQVATWLKKAAAHKSPCKLNVLTIAEENQFIHKDKVSIVTSVKKMKLHLLIFLVS